MPEYLAPGVFIEEISTRAKPIEGVGTSTAGFVGPTERGPEYPRLVTSWLEFQRWYGTYLPTTVSYMPYCIQGFFDNGGQRCFVGRITPDNVVPSQLLIDNLRFSAIGRGAWGDRVRIKVAKGSQSTAANPQFRVSIIYYRVDPATFVDPLVTANLTNPDRRDPDAVEIYDNLSEIDGVSNNVLQVINAASQLVRCWWEAPDAPAALPPQDFAPLAGGSDGDVDYIAKDFEGNLDAILPAIAIQQPPLDEPLGRGTGMAAMASIDEIAILLAPDEVRPGLENVTKQLIDQCEQLKDRFAIVSTKRAQSDVNAIASRQDTKYGAFYYPWIEVFDPLNNKPQIIPPSGHVCGIYARTDIERGVHKAPANAVVRGARNLEFTVTRGMQEFLNPQGVNCIRDFRSDGRGLRLWGARTMSSDGEWKYVNVRRLFIYIEESIEEGTQWVVFEPNHEPTWAKVVRSITNFLITIWKNGALEGVKQEEAFFVKCDRTTMTQDDIDNGRLICYIGIAPVRPAEFVIFRISQKTREATG